MRRLGRNQKGFTLVELIVVIAILAAIAGIVTPILINQVNDSKVQTDRANAKTIENAILRSVARDDLALPLVDSTATVAKIGAEINPIPTCEVTGNKFVVNKATGKVMTKSTVDTATEFEIVP
ncbi:MAG: prepilin-type N-terminal cleavage/methylation domain-containing protein [Solirubrobacterales bacterium]